MASQLSHTVWMVEDNHDYNNHHAIFIQTSTEGWGPTSGYIFGISGTLAEGLWLDHGKARSPETHFTFMSKQFCGRVSSANFKKVKGICESVPLPRGNEQGSLENEGQLELVAGWCQNVIGKMRDVGILEE